MGTSRSLFEAGRSSSFKGSIGEAEARLKDANNALYDEVNLRLTNLLSIPKNHTRILTFIASTARLRSVYGQIAEINAAAEAATTAV